ncbi:MAG TPA: hypothetical protein VGI10_20705 [Polyangiaceae bacterium]|jgi:hypothetical protein
MEQSQSETKPSGASVCVANIGPDERAERMYFGLAAVAIAVLLAGALLLAHAARPWRVTAFLPLWAAGTSLLQVREKTCVALARRGLRNMDNGEESIDDPNELRQVRAQARRVVLRGLAIAVVATAVFCLAP